MTSCCTTLADCMRALEADRRSKYRNRRTEYAGRAYASQKEAQFAQTLDLRKRAGEVRDWRPQVRIPLKIDGETVCTYVVDFEVFLADGTIELIETKGYETALWKLKRRMFEAIWLKDHPDVRYQVRH